jgi:hypothetical protein
MESPGGGRDDRSSLPDEAVATFQPLIKMTNQRGISLVALIKSRICKMSPDEPAAVPCVRLQDLQQSSPFSESPSADTLAWSTESVRMAGQSSPSVTPTIATPTAYLTTQVAESLSHSSSVSRASMGFNQSWLTGNSVYHSLTTTPSGTIYSESQGTLRMPEDACLLTRLQQYDQAPSGVVDAWQEQGAVATT